MAEFPAFPLWTDAYLADTTDLTTLEHGAYLLLLMAMWRAGGYLPDNDAKLARFTHLGPKQWASMRLRLIDFFTVENDHITQGRLLDELSRARERSKKASDSARAKYRKVNTSPSANASPKQSLEAATITISNTITNKEDNSLRSLAPQTASKRKGSRLSVDWVLPKAWGEWALENVAGSSVEFIRSQADLFKDHWISKAGAGATKMDWEATWRNWMRNASSRMPSSKIARLPVSTSTQQAPGEAFADLAEFYRAQARREGEDSGTANDAVQDVPKLALYRP